MKKDNVVVYDDYIIGQAKDVANYILVKTTHEILNKHLDSEEGQPLLEQASVDLSILNGLKNELVKVSSNPMGGYFIRILVEKKELEQDGLSEDNYYFIMNTISILLAKEDKAPRGYDDAYNLCKDLTSKFIRSDFYKQEVNLGLAIELFMDKYFEEQEQWVDI